MKTGVPRDTSAGVGALVLLIGCRPTRGCWLWNQDLWIKQDDIGVIARTMPSVHWMMLIS